MLTNRFFNFDKQSLRFLKYFTLTSAARPSLNGLFRPTCSWAMWKDDETPKTSTSLSDVECDSENPLSTSLVSSTSFTPAPLSRTLNLKLKQTDFYDVPLCQILKFIKKVEISDSSISNSPTVNVEYDNRLKFWKLNFYTVQPNFDFFLKFITVLNKNLVST